MDERIVNIIAAKSFDTLTASEKDWVLETMTEAEYQRLYTTLQLAPQLDESVVPSPRLRASLIAQFEKPVPLAPTPQPAWYLRGVPVWQAAAVWLLVAGTMMTLSRPGRKSEPVVQTIQTIDTVYVEKIVWKERVVVKTVKTKVPTEMASVADSVSRTPKPVAGTSIAAQPELMQFFTSSKK